MPIVVPVAKQAQGSTASNTVDTPIQAYLNPGAWTRGRTDFALVNGSDAVVFSLQKPPNDDRRIRGAGAYSEVDFKDTFAFRFIVMLKEVGFPAVIFRH